MLKNIYQILLVVLLGLIGVNIQANTPVAHLKSTDFDLADLLDEFGQNKSFSDTTYMLPCLIALSYYPELKEAFIVFDYSNMKTTMQARPTAVSVFKQKNKRKYKVLINKRTDAEVTLAEISFNGQVGIIGHELAHILFYEQCKPSQLVKTGISYLSKKGYHALEKQTDQITIERGLGWQLHDCYHHIQHKSRATESYKAFKRKVYYTPTQIKAKIKKMTSYKHTWSSNLKSSLGKIPKPVG